MDYHSSFSSSKVLQFSFQVFIFFISFLFFLIYSLISWYNFINYSAFLNPLRAKWPMEVALISSSVVLSGWESLTPPGWTLIYRRLAPSRRWYSFTYPGRMESWVSLGVIEGRTNIQISWSEGRNFTNSSQELWGALRTSVLFPSNLKTSTTI